MIQKGKIVEVEYEGKFDNGKVFDTSKHGEHSHPLQFEIGANQVIPGFEKAVAGMKKGETKTIKLKPEQAYGQPNPDLIRELPKQGLPEQAKEGMMIGLTLPDGKQVPGKIVKINKDKVKLDLNHPLAGKTLNFEIKILDVKDR